MSECVVRMEMPKSCKKCISTNCIWGKEGSDYLDVIAALQDFRRANNAGFPDFCPIICSLPEGHGDLIDRDALIDMVKTEDISLYTCFDSDDAYYSVTDLITILMMQKEIIKAKRKVNASDAVAPTDTPTDTPTAPAERREEK